MARREALARPFAALVDDLRQAFRAIGRNDKDGRRPAAVNPPKGKRQATMKTEDTRNLFLAIALSVLVMAAWQYFYAGPLYQKQHQAQLQAQTQAQSQASEPSQPAGAPAANGSPGVSPPGGASASAANTSVPDALAATPRVAIDTPSVAGSIDLKGGKLDDLVLKDYRETINKKSPLIRLLSPGGAPDAYWATTGYRQRGAAPKPRRSTQSGPPMSRR